MFKGAIPVIIHSKMFRKGLELLEKVGDADIVVAIRSRNDADAIRHVAETAGQGLRKYLRDLKPVLINIDEESDDGTPDEFLKSDIHNTIEFMTAECERKKEGTSVYDKVFRAAIELRAKFCLFFNGKSVSIKPQWTERFVAPLFMGDYQYVSPFYLEPPLSWVHRDFFLYPLFGALYGIDLRNPFPDDFALHGDVVPILISHQLEEDKGLHDLMVIKALRHSWKICECIPGNREDSSSVIDKAIRESYTDSTALLDALGKTEPMWCRKMEESISPPLVGEATGYRGKIPCINPEDLLQYFRSSIKPEKSIVNEIFSKGICSELMEIVGKPYRKFVFTENLWVEMMYELVISFKRKIALREKILNLLPGLLIGRIIPLVRESRESPEERIKDQAQLFFDARDNFIAQWQA